MKITTVDIPMLAEALKKLELRFEEDTTEGATSLGVGFENLGIRLRMQGDNAIIVASGQILVDFTDAEAEQLFDACNDWNRDRLMPKTYPSRMPDDTTRIMLESSLGVESGLNEEQLLEWVRWVFNTFLQATAELLHTLRGGTN